MVLDSLRSTSVLVALAVMMTATAGCFADETDPAGTQSTDGTTGADATDMPGNTSLNADPVLEVSVSFNDTELSLSNGSYAVAVGDNLTFDASESSDPDGDNLTFTWDFGDGNTSTDQIAVYAYSVAGNYSVTVEAADGNGGTASATLNLTVEPGGPAPGTVLRDEKKTYTGTYTAGVQGTSCVNNVQGSGASKANEFIVPATEAGVNVAANKFVLKLTGGTTTADQAMRFAGPDGKVIKDMDAGSGANEDITVEGEFPPGKYTITVYGCVAVNGSWTLVATATLVAA